MKTLSIPEKHQLRIAKQVLRESEAMTLVMGGMTKDEAREICNRYGIPHVESSVDPDTTKSVEYSYPTSDNAIRFGFEQEGCWTVQRVSRDNGQLRSTEAIAGFATLTEALEHARAWPLPWCSLCLAYHPEYA